MCIIILKEIGQKLMPEIAEMLVTENEEPLWVRSRTSPSTQPATSESQLW